VCPIRVLMVDRSAFFANSAARFLSMNPNLEIVGHVSSAQGALNQTRELSPDLVLVDLGLRHASAFDLTRQMKAINPSSKVVLLGLHDNEHYERAARRAGADAFLPKWDFASHVWRVLAGLFDGRLSGETDDREVRRVRESKCRIPQCEPSSLGHP